VRSAYIIVYGLLLTVVYLLYTGSTSTVELVLAVLSGVVVAAVFSKGLIQNSSKISLGRFLKSIQYLILYFTVIEIKAHWSVLKLILKPNVSYRPAIVRIPYDLESDYSVFAVANSITNTPGTVVVDLDEKEKHFYVHWINAPSLNDEEAKRMISLDFEKRIREIFE